MNPKFRNPRILIPIILILVLTIVALGVLSNSSTPSSKLTSMQRNLQLQFSMRTFAIDRWNKKFVGARTANVNVGPFRNEFGEIVGVEISTTDFNPSSDSSLSGDAWKNKVVKIFGDLKTKRERDFLCQMFFTGLMYEGDNLGKYFPNHRVELRNLGLIPYSFDEIELIGDFRKTIKYPTPQSPATLFRCKASGIYIKMGGGYSPPYTTIIAWQYSRRTGTVEAEMSLSLLNP